MAEHAGQVVATAHVFTDIYTPKGHVRLEKDAAAPEAAEAALLHHAAQWLTGLDKRAMQVAVPGQVTPPAYAAAENRHSTAYLFRMLENV